MPIKIGLIGGGTTNRARHFPDKINAPGHVITRHIRAALISFQLRQYIFPATTSDDHHSLSVSRVFDMWVLESDGDLLEGISELTVYA